MAQVLVVGSLHYDIVVEAPHLPARDETVIGGDIRFVCGGKGGNQAVAASRHGATVAFAGAVGRDFFADALLGNLRDAGVETGEIARVPQAASGMSVAIVEGTGDYGAVVASGANRLIDPEIIDVPADTGFLLLQNEIPDKVNLAVARKARDAGAQVILNAAPMRELPSALLACVDMLIVNRVEASALLGGEIGAAENATNALVNGDIDVEAVIVTLGADGLVFRSGAATPQSLQAHAVNVVSTHGAGDAFVGALAARLAAEDGLEDALTYASTAAALHVSTTVEERQNIGPDSVAGFLKERG